MATSVTQPESGFSVEFLSLGQSLVCAIQAAKDIGPQADSEARAHLVSLRVLSSFAARSRIRTNEGGRDRTRLITQAKAVIKFLVDTVDRKIQQGVYRQHHVSPAVLLLQTAADELDVAIYVKDSTGKIVRSRTHRHGVFIPHHHTKGGPSTPHLHLTYDGSTFSADTSRSERGKSLLWKHRIVVPRGQAPKEAEIPNLLTPEEEAVFDGPREDPVNPAYDPPPVRRPMASIGSSSSEDIFPIMLGAAAGLSAILAGIRVLVGG